MRRILSPKGIAVFIALTSFMFCSRGKNEQPVTEETAGTAPVRFMTVAKQRISEKLVYTGTLEARRKINITPDIGGKVARIYVEEGQRVKEGDIVAELDTQAIRLQLKQAEAVYAVAEASYTDAKRNKERMDRLLEEKAVSEQQHEKVKLAFEAAEAQLQQAQAALNLARHGLDVSIMKAPWNGVVSSKNVEVGDVINPMMGGYSGASGVLTLMDFSKIKIIVDVSSADIPRIKKGQTALLRGGSFPDKEFRGAVQVINLTADPMTKKFKVEVAVDNPDYALRPGTFGEVVLEVSTHEDALVLPQKAVVENKYVYLVQDGKALKREITLGLQNSSWVEILSGVKEGDRVIVEGNYGLEDGAAVEVRGEVKR